MKHKGRATQTFKIYEASTQTWTRNSDTQTPMII